MTAPEIKQILARLDGLDVALETLQARMKALERHLGVFHAGEPPRLRQIEKNQDLIRDLLEDLRDPEGMP